VRKPRLKPPAGLAKTPPKPEPEPKPAPWRRPNAWICLALLVATFAVYAPVRHFDFVNFDDPEYVRDNPHVRAGLTPQTVAWAFSSTESANWFPVTRLSHLLDAQLFGMRPGPQHLTSVLIHALAALCLFAFLLRATRARWPSAFVAMLFALHPTHVESVAWVAERKDVLCALFWFLALWAYVRYSERPSAGRYLLVLLPFCLGLMSKPMIVTLPLVLLLLDYWPLGRRRALREKIPFFALASAAALATYWVQRGSGAVEALTAFPLGLRLENALLSYVVYAANTLWPTRLAVFYPYPSQIPLWLPGLAAAALAAISIAVLRSARSRPYLAAGWLWYLVTLAPVIGLVQVGAQARADRYLYVPMVGLAIMLAWGAADWLRRAPRLRPAVAALAAAACLASAALAAAQVRHWKDSEALFSHALAVTDGNYLAHHNLGVALAEMPGRLPEAMAHYQAALAIQPGSARAHTDLGNALARLPGRAPEAVAEYREALRLSPDSAIPHNNLGNALAGIPGRLPEAIAEYQAALRIDPDYAEAHNNLGFALAQTPGRLPDATREYREALRIRPDYAEAHANLAAALAESPASLPGAVTEYEAALRLQPGMAEVHYNLALALSKMEGRAPDAIAQFEEALRIKPDYAEAHNNLGVVLTQFPNRITEAMGHFEAAVRIDPGYVDAHYNLGAALAGVPGRMPEAIQQFETVLRLRPDPEVRELVGRLRAGGR
jgi:tetratricopeptide (TPR) repeat protein